MPQPSGTATSVKTALVVRGGWPGHSPVETSEWATAFLRGQGVEVTVSDTLEAYEDLAELQTYDLVVQSWTMGEISDDQAKNLIDAVAAGTGLAGWHGGIVDAFRGSLPYHQLTGAQFLEHPGGQVAYTVRVLDGARMHPIVRDIDTFDIHTEQYWVSSDDYNDVLAVTEIAADATTPWLRPIEVPVIWTRQWGRGKVYVNTIGHQRSDFDIPEVAATIQRGLVWASR